MKTITRTHKFYLSSIIAIQYLSGLYFFFLQGRVISAILKKYPLHYIASMLVSMILVKSVMILSRTTLEHTKKQIENIITARSLLSCFPTIIYKDFSHRANVIFHTLNNHIQKKVNSRINIFINRIVFLCVFIIYFTYIIYSKFFIGGAFVALIGISTFLNYLSWGSTYHTMLHQQHELEKKFITWIHDYFNNYKEITHTWAADLKENKWLSSLYDPYMEQKKKINSYTFKRHIWGQCLVETPYLITSTAIFLAIYYHQISLSLAFSWLGVSQFMITASQGLSQNGEFKKLCSDSHKKITSLLDDIKEKTSPAIQHATMISPSRYHIVLHNNHHVTFQMQPGIYPIIAPNGTGKSTLFDTIIGFDRHSTFNTHPAIITLKNIPVAFQNSAIKLVENPSSLFLKCHHDTFQYC